MRKHRFLDQETLDFIKSPLVMTICGVVATLMAFSAGIIYARNTADVVFSNEGWCCVQIGRYQRILWEEEAPPFP